MVLNLTKNGHGTHVAGIIAAAGRNRFDETVGVAPGANIISLKVLDAKGRGFAGDVIEAIYWAIANRTRFNIRVINMSLGGPVTQSWRDDPRARRSSAPTSPASRSSHRQGTSVRPRTGGPSMGCITAPGNSPFVDHCRCAEHEGHGVPERRRGGELQL